MDARIRDQIVKGVMACEECPNVRECQGEGNSLREELESAPDEALAWIKNNLIDWCMIAARETRVPCDIAAVGNNLDAEAAELLKALQERFVEEPV